MGESSISLELALLPESTPLSNAQPVVSGSAQIFPKQFGMKICDLPLDRWPHEKP
jgi:hypothetical protein